MKTIYSVEYQVVKYAEWMTFDYSETEKLARDAYRQIVTKDWYYSVRVIQITILEEHTQEKPE